MDRQHILHNHDQNIQKGYGFEEIMAIDYEKCELESKVIL